MNVYEVGKPFPGPIPKNDGLYFEIGPDGDMVLIIQFYKPSNYEKSSLKEGFKSYSYYEAQDCLACWVFKYPAPVSYMDAPFHAGLYRDDRIGKFLSEERNALTVYVLDGEILQSIRYIGFHPEAMKAFHKTIEKQTQGPVSREAYKNSIENLSRYSSKEIYNKGLIFSHREVKQ